MARGGDPGPELVGVREPDPGAGTSDPWEDLPLDTR